MIIEYELFQEELEKTIYRNAKAYLLNKMAEKPERYVGLFRTTSPRIKLLQNITQSREISFGDFVENIITMYLGVFYENLPKKAKYNGEDIMFDQLFLYDNKIFMIEQKIRDDHDSTKKRGQFNNFVQKNNYLKEKFPNKEIISTMWFVDTSLKKNKKYYLSKIQEYCNVKNVKMNIFYGDELFIFLGNISIWNEMTSYLQRWKEFEEDNIELNFENNWEETKEELIKHVSKRNWKKLIYNFKIREEVLPILFPTKKYTELLDYHNLEIPIEFVE